MAACDSCGLTLSETATFCPTCGATVVAASADSAASYGSSAPDYAASYAGYSPPSPPGATSLPRSEPHSSDRTEIAIAAGVLAAVVVVRVLLGAGPVFELLMVAWWCAALYLGMRVFRVGLSIPHLLVTVAVLHIAQLIVGILLGALVTSCFRSRRPPCMADPDSASTSRHRGRHADRLPSSQRSRHLGDDQGQEAGRRSSSRSWGCCPHLAIALMPTLFFFLVQVDVSEDGRWLPWPGSSDLRTGRPDVGWPPRLQPSRTTARKVVRWNSLFAVGSMTASGVVF